MNPVVLPQPLPSEVVVFLEDRMRLLGHSTRIRTLDELRGGERNVQSIADAMMTTQQNVSGHLRLLRSAGAVSRRPAGREVLYALRDTSILDVWRSCSRASRLAPMAP